MMKILIQYFHSKERIIKLVNDNVLTLTVNDYESGIRIDKFISENEYLNSSDLSMSRSYIQKLIKDNMVKINDLSIKPSRIVEEGDVVTLSIPTPVIPEIIAKDIPLDIVFEDDDIIIVNKPKNMVVHPAPGHYDDTLVNALMYHCGKDLSGINGVLRPGIVHRIDMNTTGLLVICKNDFAHNHIALQLKEHSITRKYEAIVYNHFSTPEGTVDGPLGRCKNDRKKMCITPDGRNAITHYKLIKNLDRNMAHIECQLETGRTHQIRVHMTSINHPLLGDDIYGNGKSSFNTCGQALHARTLGFIHPRTNEYMEFTSELPDYFMMILDKLNINKEG